MEPPSANGDDAEILGAELNYGNNFGYYGLQANLSPALCERMLCSERAKELQEVVYFTHYRFLHLYKPDNSLQKVENLFPCVMLMSFLFLNFLGRADYYIS